MNLRLINARVANAFPMSEKHYTENRIKIGSAKREIGNHAQTYIHTGQTKNILFLNVVYQSRLPPS